MNTRYEDGHGLVFFVSDGVSGGEVFMTVKQKLNSRASGTHRVVSKNLPLRKSRVAAEIDLAEYAKKRNLKPIEVVG